MTAPMKKRAYGYGLLLVGLLVLLLLAAPGTSDPSQDSSGPETGSSNSISTLSPREEQVHIYTCDEDLCQILTQLGQQYTQQTGITVTVTSAGGADCATALAAAMDSDNAPTIFCLHSLEDMTTWQSVLYDLTDTEVAGQLCHPGFALEVDGKQLALTMDTDCYGLLYNATLLARTGFTRSDILSYADLEMVCRYITSQGLGYAAFAPFDLSDASHKGLGCLLAGILPEQGQLRDFCDLYLQNGQTDGQSLARFLQEEAVFYVGGTWDYESISSLGGNSLDILPAYTADGGCLQYISALSWGLNNTARQLDIQVSLEFLTWLVTAGEDTPAPIDQLGLLSPFRDAASYGNPLEKKLREYMRTEEVSVSWECCDSLTERQLAQLTAALDAYSTAPTDENWAKVAALLP